MTMRISDLTKNAVERLLDYNPETGRFVWKINTKGARAGREAGVIVRDGYRRISINRRHYFAHCIAMLLMTGEWPTTEIDHIDGIPSNNTWTNLRMASRKQNGRNRKINRNNTSGFKGVSWSSKAAKWQTGIMVDGRSIYLGSYWDIRNAAAAYNKAAHKYFGEFSRGA